MRNHRTEREFPSRNQLAASLCWYFNDNDNSDMKLRRCERKTKKFPIEFSNEHFQGKFGESTCLVECSEFMKNIPENDKKGNWMWSSDTRRWIVSHVLSFKVIGWVVGGKFLESVAIEVVGGFVCWTKRIFSFTCSLSTRKYRKKRTLCALI